MSYILDAMLQAERERRCPLTPGLSTVQVLPRLPRPPRRRWPLAAAGLAGLAALALAAALLLPDPEAPPAAKPVAIVGPEAVAPPAAALVKLADPAAAPPVPALVPPPAGPADLPAAAPKAPPEMPVAEPAAAPAAEAPLPRRPAPRAQPRAKARAVAAVPGKRIYRPAELPPELRRTADAIKVAGFAWSDDPKERLVIINNRALREGEEVSRGLRVEHIVGDGVVFSLKGYRFRKGPT